MAKETTANGGKQKASKQPKAAGKPNIFARLGQYLRDVRSEMRRVVWPGRQEVINSSLVVIVALVFFALFTLVVDSAVVEILRLIRQIGG